MHASVILTLDQSMFEILESDIVVFRKQRFSGRISAMTWS
jgi:hypothetical protein